MSVLLFRLRNVPDDEADDIRELLSTNNLEFYETTAGAWGISTAAIWLKHNDDVDKAKQLVEHYQHERGVSQRESYGQLKESGEHKTLWYTFAENPVRFIAYLALAALIIYVSIKPFLSLSH